MKPTRLYPSAFPNEGLIDKLSNKLAKEEEEKSPNIKVQKVISEKAAIDTKASPVFKIDLHQNGE